MLSFFFSFFIHLGWLSYLKHLSFSYLFAPPFFLSFSFFFFLVSACSSSSSFLLLMARVPVLYVQLISVWNVFPSLFCLFSICRSTYLSLSISLSVVLLNDSWKYAHLSAFRTSFFSSISPFFLSFFVGVFRDKFKRDTGIEAELKSGHG